MGCDEGSAGVGAFCLCGWRFTYTHVFIRGAGEVPSSSSVCALPVLHWCGMSGGGYEWR